ncbi:MAG: hypothetical protein GXP53_09455 [Deltaproteobacteria bacterium]|nr:hypothetical protein [Deltaproteobacteria bacterium]
MGKKKDNDKTVNAASSERKQRKKVREAFRIVENLDNYRDKGTAKSRAAPGPERSPKKKGGGSGLRLRFGLDALISASDTRAAKDKNLQPGESRLVDIHITIPYVWKIPILGKKALGMVRKIQAQGYPESIRDILKSLRAKSPL